MRQILFLSLSDSSSGTAPEFRACFDLSSCWTSASSTYSTSSYLDATSISIIVTILSRQSLSDKESARVLEDRRLFVRWQKTWTDLSSILTTFSPTTNIFQNYCGCCFLTSPPHPSSSNKWTNTNTDTNKDSYLCFQDFRYKYIEADMSHSQMLGKLGYG